ncbi:MAG: hypothetical protein RMJ31_02795 [Nitrososphaerota archaeon]|nr:hypothetical protein [Nitrososphaerales archaeon]MDW8044685.1 hypothetical protein [Nitrososphaerota archaeon]
MSIESDIERKLRERLPIEDFELVSQLLRLSASQVRDFIENKVREIADVESEEG